MSLLISSVSAGDQSSFGTAGVVNAALGISVPGVETFVSGKAITSFDVPSRLLAIDLTTAVTLPPPTSVRLTFNGALVQPAPTLGDTFSSGTLEIRNLAFAFYPAGIDSLKVPTPRIAWAVPANNLVLDLTATVTSPTARNVSFTFGGAQMSTGVSVGDTSIFGTYELTQAFGARPAGIFAEAVSAPLVRDAAINGGRLVLDLVATATSLTRLDFTETTRPVTGVGVSESTAFGVFEIVNAAQAFYPLGTDVASYGVPLVYIPTIRDGFVPLEFSNDKYDWPALNVPFYFNDPFGVGFPGIDSLVFGNLVIATDALTIAPGGIASTTVFGNQTLRGDHKVFPTGVPAPTGQFPTTHGIGHYTRFIDLAGIGINQATLGNPRAEFTLRYIEPPYIISNVFGTHNVARIQLVEPAGWDSSFISENHEFDINLQRIIVPTGEADPAQYGVTHIRNQFELIYPSGWLSQNINFPVVYNLDQYLFVQPYMDTNSDPTQWPSYAPFVENKNRVLGPSGWQSSRFSIIGNLIEPGAIATQPAGFDATEWGSGTFIAYRNRTLTPEGWDSFYNTQYTVIYNNAVVLSAQGWSSSALGTPEQVLNLNRTVTHIFPYDGESLGTPFIAYRIRSIYPGLFYDVPSGFPEVRFNPYPIAPAGIVPPQFGAPTVFNHFNELLPKSTNVHSVPWVGEPVVLNKNKTLYVSPSDQSLYGLAKVFNYNTHITLSAGDMSVWGSHLIRDRTQQIAPAPASTPTFSVTHRIRNDMPDPPSLQRVEPNGIVPDNVGYPALRLATLFPEGIDESAIGQPVFTRNTLEAPSLPFTLDQLGTPVLIYTQYMYPKSAPWPRPGAPNDPFGDSDVEWPKPRLTPHTIYAPAGTEATQQAKNNHQPNGELISGISSSDGIWSLGGGWPWFGRPDVTNQYRSIGPVPNHNPGYPSQISPSSRYGTPEVTLRLRRIYASPIRSQRFGLPMIPGVPQSVNLDSADSGIPPLNAFGQTTVAHPYVEVQPEVRPSGFVATTFGTAFLESSIRYVYPEAINHRGNPEQGLTSPWGLPLVGYPRVYGLGGYDFTLWGTTWVSHKNRDLPVEGWNSLTLEDDDLVSFADRMKVSRRNPEDAIAGIPSVSAFGTAEISHSIRAVLGHGISSYNSGIHIISAVTTISPTGWDSAEIGNIDKWEAGKVKPHGDELSIMGTPRILNPLRPQGIDSAVFAAPRVARGIRPMGLPEIGFAGPSISNPYGCSTRVVVPLPVLSQEYVPTPTVTS